MKPTAILAAFALGSVAMGQSQQFEPFSVGYQWSFSGKQYATINYALREDVWLKGLNFTGVAGYELKTGAQPSMGFGFTYRIDARPAYAEIGVFALFPQKQVPDFGIGLQFGVKF